MAMIVDTFTIYKRDLRTDTYERYNLVSERVKILLVQAAGQ